MRIYMALICLVSALVFDYDKSAAQKHRRRVPERVLHVLELLGGVWVVVPLMYLIHHKNRKRSYFLISYAILALWIAGIVYLCL